MERADQSSTGGEYSGGASASATWESYEESPPLPFPERFPEFRNNYSREERFSGMNNEGALMNGGGSSATRDDPKSCFVASTTFSFFVVMTMAFGLYASETLRLGPNSSILMKPNHLFVEYIKVVAVDASKGAMLYGFYKDPPLDVKTTWSETHKITLPASTHKEWIYYLNEGSQISISYSVNSRSSSSLILVIAEGEAGLSEWLKEPSYPNITPSWNIIHGTGVIQKDISDSSTYYIAVGNLNNEYAEASVHLNTTIRASLYNTTDSYYKCKPSEGQCTFQLFISSGNAAVLTSPGRSPGMVSGDWHVKLSYGPRWITYLKASGIGLGNSISIGFCSSCSYRGTAVTMKNMLESQFPGINVVLANYPPPFPKRVLSKLVPIVQFGVIGIIIGGEQIFPRLGFAAPPQWYYSMRANRFGSMASTWLLGNFLQSFLQSSGAFEVYCNGELVFSKLKENRFPGEIELKDLVARRISSSRVVDGINGGQWS
ncbi:SelT-like protein [Striga hermonthica]|uniref:SelT-like protein n=1 Tax=Striga hermonthica TaxID=68872 RepID=A0A9N7RI73_STRHE|nr:SelT-like protein [Striga hermonthica]